MIFWDFQKVSNWIPEYLETVNQCSWKKIGFNKSPSSGSLFLGSAMCQQYKHCVVRFATKKCVAIGGRSVSGFSGSQSYYTQQSQYKKQIQTPDKSKTRSQYNTSETSNRKNIRRFCLGIQAIKKSCHISDEKNEPMFVWIREFLSLQLIQLNLDVMKPCFEAFKVLRRLRSCSHLFSQATGGSKRWKKGEKEQVQTGFLLFDDRLWILNSLLNGNHSDKDNTSLQNKNNNHKNKSTSNDDYGDGDDDELTTRTRTRTTTSTTTTRITTTMWPSRYLPNLCLVHPSFLLLQICSKPFLPKVIGVRNILAALNKVKQLWVNSSSLDIWSKFFSSRDSSLEGAACPSFKKTKSPSHQHGIWSLKAPSLVRSPKINKVPWKTEAWWNWGLSTPMMCMLPGSKRLTRPHTQASCRFERCGSFRQNTSLNI